MGIAAATFILVACALCGTASARPYWVFLRDRGPAAADPAALAERIRPEVWARRAIAGSPLPDELDRPVWEPYAREVARHGRLRQRSHWLNAVSVELTPADSAEVARLPFVTRIRPVAVARQDAIGPLPLDATTQPFRALAAPPEREGPERILYGPSFGQLSEIGVPALQTLGFSGNRVRFMMLDTGFRKDHDAFARAKVEAEWDFVFGDGRVQNEPDDAPTQQNHGTGCWSTAGGYVPGVLIGPAYGATFVLAKTEDVRSETRAEEDNYVAALEWADTLGVVLTSASLSYLRFDDGFNYTFEDKDGDTAVITRAVDIAAGRGILCVNSVGNFGCETGGTLGTPADADSVVSVGAVDSLGVIAYFSACGPTFDGRTKPEVVARGVHTLWADANGHDYYGYASGTSLSTPLVSGALALLMEAHPEWSAMQARQILMDTADRAGAPDGRYGWGRVSAPAALYSTPLLYPFPFSLIDPTDSTDVMVYRPTFSWHSTTDPDSPEPVSYTLWVDEIGGALASWALPTGADTLFTMPFALVSGACYRWHVSADDVDGNRRESREDLLFCISAALQSVDGDAAPARLRLTCGPNPLRGAMELRVTGACPSAPGWTVFDALGRRVASGVTSPSGDGYAGRWDGRLPGGGPAGPGVYFLEARAGARVLRTTLVRLAD
jgi:subtilisin family serine protease